MQQANYRFQQESEPSRMSNKQTNKQKKNHNTVTQKIWHSHLITELKKIKIHNSYIIILYNINILWEQSGSYCICWPLDKTGVYDLLSWCNTNEKYKIFFHEVCEWKWSLYVLMLVTLCLTLWIFGCWMCVFHFHVSSFRRSPSTGRRPTDFPLTSQTGFGGQG